MANKPLTKKESMVDKFNLFLRKHDAASKFYANACKGKKGNNPVLTGDPKCWILNPFFWGGTPQGYAFWNNLDNQWFAKLQQSK